ncbi:MAG: HAMP domain-containing sensor histidine kinase [Bacteroidota bacterium]
MAVLILIQINWLTKAVSLQQEQSHAQLQKLVPDIALSINEIDHNMFHDTLLNLSSLDLELVGYKVDSLLELHGIKQEVVFSLYKEGKQNIFLANETAYKEELLRSDIKSCMSCIVSFSIVRDTSGLGKRGDEGFEERLMERSEFQYYSPVSNAKERKGEILWFSLYQPSPLSAAIESLIFMFSLSLILLLVLLGLFFHVLRSLSRHKKLSQVKNDFFNNVSHEFKTPLSSIRLASKVLQKSKNPEKNLIYHQLIEKESLLLEQEIDKLLELSLLDNKELPFEFEEVNLRQIIAEIPKRLKLLIEEKHAKLELDLEEDIRPLKGDPTHLSNSFCNLVENSLKYSADEVEVHISSTHEGKHHTIRIRDNGPGIKAEFQDQIFDRFFRGQKNDQYKGQGFGIGLSYVKSVIEAHKGSIQLNKTYTEGTEFIIKLSYA